MNSGKPNGGSVDGNPEPSQRYTVGRCRDYLRAAVPLMTVQRPAPDRHEAEGEEIVHARRKLRGNVNPLVLGSNPSGPTTISREAARCNEIECGQDAQDSPDEFLAPHRLAFRLRLGPRAMRASARPVARCAVTCRLDLFSFPQPLPVARVRPRTLRGTTGGARAAARLAGTVGCPITSNSAPLPRRWWRSSSGCLARRRKASLRHSTSCMHGACWSRLRPKPTFASPALIRATTRPLPGI